MKKCPQCGRDYNDDSMSFCLDDGSELLFGPAKSQESDETQTAILHETAPPNEAATRAQIYTTERTAVFPITDGGEPKSKSLDKRLLLAPVALAVIVLGGFFGYRYFISSGSSGPISSIAVLPLQNNSGNADSEYLSDGLAESLIYRLSQLPDLKVSSASSVMRYKGQAVDPQKIAAELGVQAILSGRLTQRGESLSVSVELIEAATNKTLWGEQYDRRMSDLLATQREIAATIADKLQLRLSGTGAKGITKKYTDSNEAYQLYLKGRHQWNKRTRESLKQAVEHYNRAIDADPSFALAYAGLADAYVLFSNYDVASAKDSMPQAKAAAQRALELDESLAEAHTAYAYYLMLYEYDFNGSEAAFRRAIELDPKYPTARQWFGEMLSKLKRFDEAMAQTMTAQQLDPLSPVISFNVGFQHYMARRYDEALAAYDVTLRKFPEFKVTHFGRCWAIYAKGDLANAVTECRRARELVSESPIAGFLAMALARSGNVEEAKSILEDLRKESERRHVPATAFAYIYIGLNQKEEALNMMEREVAERGYLAPDYAVNPEYDEFRSDPRFKAVLKKMNLPE